MKIILVVLSILVTAGIVTRAEAQNYPWCSIYTGSMGGSKNCGFSSFQQCMANVSGIGDSASRTTRIVRRALRPCGTGRTSIPDQSFWCRIAFARRL